MSSFSAQVSFTPPADNGGTPITKYVVTALVGGQPTSITATGTASPILVTGLTEGVTYTFEVAAVNSVGTGPESTPSNAITPSTVPSVPTAVVPTPGNAAISVAFGPPTDDGGSAVTGYLATASTGSPYGLTQTGTSSPINITGLVNGTGYFVSVQAKNVNGYGDASIGIGPYTPQANVPGSPTGVTAVGGNASATVSFTPPTYNGGAAITGYTATAYVGGTATAVTKSGAGSPLVFSSTLTNGVTYTFAVVATNSVGNSLPSAQSNPVTPATGVTVPGAPTGLVASVQARQQSATVVFSPPANTGGAAITQYTVTAYVSSVATSIAASGAASPISVPGLTYGTNYTFAATATNSAGTGPASVQSNVVTPYTLPGAPGVPSAVAGNASATVSFAAAAANGSAVTEYTVTSSPGGITAQRVGSPISVPGLTNGTSYNFTVVATNAAGNGPASAVSNSVTPSGSLPFNAPTMRMLPQGKVGSSYSYTFPITGGTGPYTGTIVNVSNNNKSSVCGSGPAVENTWSFGANATLQCTNLAAAEVDYIRCTLADSAGHSYTANYVVNVGANFTPLIINTPIALGNVQSGVPVNVGTVTCVGNVGTPVWSMPSVGGLSINSSTGVISGTPTGGIGAPVTYSLVVTVKDGTYTATQTLYVTVNQYLQAPRPSYNTGSGFFVFQSELYDNKGNLFRIRGLDSMAQVTDAGVAVVQQAGANAARLMQTSDFTQTLVSLSTQCKNLGVVPIPMVYYVPFEGTCAAWTNGPTSTSCCGTASVLTESVARWVAQYPAYVAAGLMDYMILNIANEWGPNDLPSYQSEYITAVATLRSTGYTCPLMIDANGCGQNYLAITETAAAIFNSDPQKNIVFGFHCYGGTSQANALPYFTAMKNAANAAGFCVAVMEFGPYLIPSVSATQIPTQTLVSYCEQVGIGYAGWAIDNNNCNGGIGNDTSGFAMMYNNFSATPAYPSNLTQYGKYLCLDPIYGLQANARTASSV